MTADASATARLFFALWPDARVRAALVERRQHWHWPPRARPTPAARLHATLHFLGDVPRERIPALLALRAGMPTDPYGGLRLDTAALWRGGIAVLESAAPPAGLAELQARLGALLRREGLATEPAARFRPHVTLARAAQGARPPDTVEPIDWLADEVVLVESRRGSPDGYVVLTAGGPGAA
jgi:2'-5' RNA ligase